MDNRQGAIGNIRYYVLKYSRSRKYSCTHSMMHMCLVRASPFYDKNLPCPKCARYPSYLAVWQSTNKANFHYVAGVEVMKYIRSRQMSLAEFCTHYSDIGKSCIASIKAQESQ